MLDKSTVYVLAEGMDFFGQKPIKFQLFGLSTACLKLFQFLHREEHHRATASKYNATFKELFSLIEL